MIRILLMQFRDVFSLLSGPDHPFGGNEIDAPPL